MRKIVVFISLVLTIIIVGCTSNSMKEPPEISINIGDKEIEYVSAKNKWDGSVYDREDTFITILKDQKDIPVFKTDSIAEVTFKGKLPDKFIVSDILIDENGRQIYTYKEIRNVQAVSQGNKYTFEIGYNYASALSSYYEPDKKDIRGFRMIASWGENECEYAFVIKTTSKDTGKQT